LINNNLPPIVISKDDRVKYFEFIKNENINEFVEWIKELSNEEIKRLKTFGYVL
jgi:hypothetical protein